MSGLNFDPGFDRNKWKDRKDYYKPSEIRKRHDQSSSPVSNLGSGDNRLTVLMILKSVGFIIAAVIVVVVLAIIIKVFRYAFL